MRIVLVDDEEIVVKGLSMVIRESGHDWQVVGTAANGLEGIKVIQECKPDIVISDIRMPDMDGLEMIKLLLNEFPDMISIVFSGYGEFNYAKTAVDLGIFSYILKPVDYENIIETLQKANDLFEKRRKEREEFSKLKAQIKESIPILREKFLSDLMHDIIYVSANHLSWFKLLEMNFMSAAVVSVRIDDLEGSKFGSAEEDKYLAMFALRNIFGSMRRVLQRLSFDK